MASVTLWWLRDVKRHVIMELGTWGHRDIKHHSMEVSA